MNARVHFIDEAAVVDGLAGVVARQVAGLLVDDPEVPAHALNAERRDRRLLFLGRRGRLGDLVRAAGLVELLPAGLLFFGPGLAFVHDERLLYLAGS